MSSTSSRGDAKDIEEEIDSNEDIFIPKFDLDNLILEKIDVMQLALHKETRQEQKRRELRQKEILHDIKDIFVEAFDISDLNVNKTIEYQLIHIVDKIHAKDIETYTNFMQWSKQKFFTKVCAKISSVIALRMVDLSTQIA